MHFRLFLIAAGTFRFLLTLCRQSITLNPIKGRLALVGLRRPFETPTN
jgi:hypothetical protein